jgi:4-hydroxy-tetrahydrodipicolinate reductase
MGIRVLFYGLGQIGLEIARHALRTPGVQVVGAVDIDPAKVGQDVGRLVGGSELGVHVSRTLGEALNGSHADVALHATSSWIERVAPELEQALEARLHVISTCEELCYPWRRHAAIARRLDAVARRRGRVLLGVGINPGFAMDVLPLALTGACRRVDRLSVSRVVDAGARRAALQRKIGAGMDTRAFQRRARTGGLGHIGLLESADMLVAALGLKLDRLERRLRPVVATRTVRTPHVVVRRGQVAGIDDRVVGLSKGHEALRLHLRMYVGARRPRDEILVEGDPSLHMVVRGGIAGDAATIAFVTNWIPRVLKAEPGLRVVSELPPVSAWRGVPAGGRAI